MTYVVTMFTKHINRFVKCRAKLLLMSQSARVVEWACLRSKVIFFVQLIICKVTILKTSSSHQSAERFSMRFSTHFRTTPLGTRQHFCSVLVWR